MGGGPAGRQGQCRADERHPRASTRRRSWRRAPPSVWAKNPDIKVLDTQYGNWSTAEAKKIAEQWIAQYGDEINAIWSGGAQMSQGIIEAYLEAGLPIPPIAGGEYSNGFLRLAKENNLKFAGWQYPNAMSIICIDDGDQGAEGRAGQALYRLQGRDAGARRRSTARTSTSCTTRTGATMSLGRSSCRKRR